MADFPPTLGAAHNEIMRVLRGLPHIACPEEASGIVPYLRNEWRPE